MRKEPTEQQFKFYSGVPCLDFLMTLRGRKEEKRETLLSFADFIDWCRLAGIVSDSQATRLKAAPSQETAKCLREAIRLRETLYRIFSGVTANRTPSDADLTWLNRLLRHETCYSQIRLDPDGRPLKETVTVPRGPWQPLIS